MSEFQAISQDREHRLAEEYARQREQLALLAELDCPQGDYLHPVFGAGNARARVLFLGEAPGREEAECGTPFVGKAGKQLNALLVMADIARADAYVTNVVKYRPVVRGERTLRNRTPDRHEIERSLPLLRFEWETIAPQMVVTLGNTPLAAMLLLFGLPRQTVGALHGKPFFIGSEPLHKTELFALYHPASAIYNRMLLPVMEQDILALGEHLVKARERTVFDEWTVI